MIDVRDLHYTYPGAKAETLQGISFEIAEREIVGFLGPSGAGKSTTQKLLIGLLKHYSGQVRVMGKEVREWDSDYYEHIGVSFELPNHYLKLSAAENLGYFASLYAGETHDPLEVLAWVGLDEDADKRVSDFSKGMKNRLNVARSLLHKPRLLFLDEPTAGLDPVNARKIKDLVLRLREAGTTVFVTTHNMMVADELCDRVAFIVNGKLVLVDAPETLKRTHGQRRVTVEYVNGEPKSVRAEFPLDGLGANEDFIRTLQEAERVETIHTQETTLENIFIAVTGERLT
jgi:fluoroquinolone transport system ATP-binding protein